MRPLREAEVIVVATVRIVSEEIGETRNEADETEEETHSLTKTMMETRKLQFREMISQKSLAEYNERDGENQQNIQKCNLSTRLLISALSFTEPFNCRCRQSADR